MSPARTSVRPPRHTSENGSDPVRVSLAAPPVSGVLRIVLGVVATALALYLVWRLRSVVQLLVISLFFAFALFPVVDAIAARTPMPRTPLSCEAAGRHTSPAGVAGQSRGSTEGCDRRGGQFRVAGSHRAGGHLPAPPARPRILRAWTITHERQPSGDDHQPARRRRAPGDSRRPAGNSHGRRHPDHPSGVVVGKGSPGWRIGADDGRAGRGAQPG